MIHSSVRHPPAWCIRLAVIALGVLVGLFATVLLRQPMIWVALFSVGITVAVASLLAPDFDQFWLAVFALALPLDIYNMLIDSAYVRELALLGPIVTGPSAKRWDRAAVRTGSQARPVFLSVPVDGGQSRRWHVAVLGGLSKGS